MMKPTWRKVLDSVDRLVLRGLGFGQHVLLWPAMYAVAWAAALWPLLHPDRLASWSKNELEQAERNGQLQLLLVCVAVVFGLLAVYAIYRFARRDPAGPASSLRGFNRLFAFSLAAPILVALSVPKIETRSPFHTMFFVVLATLPLLPTAAVLWESSQRWRERPFLRRASAFVPPLLVTALFAGYAYWFSRLSINGHHALNTRIFDLAIYDNIFYQSSHGHFLGCSLSSTGSHISGHFDPILGLLSPLYLIDPRAELILVLQAVWCGAGVFPAYLLGRDHLGSKWAGVVFAAAWALYPALHGANSYEFHSLTLLASPMLLLLYFLTTSRVKSFYLLLPLVLLIREDVSLLVCCVALAAILTRDPRMVRLGWVTFGIAALYFLITKMVIMAGVQPSVAATADPLGGKHGFGWYYADLIPKGQGLRGLLTALLSNPTFAIDLAFQEKKVVFLLQLLLPLVFLPFLAKPWRFAMAFGFFYILLATRSAVYSIGYQYSVVLFPVLFALAPIALRRVRDGRLPSLLGMPAAQLATLVLVAVLGSSALMSWKYGGFFENDAFKGGWRTPPRTLSKAQEDHYLALREFLTQIPPDASVTAVGRLGPHVSNRAEVYKYRHKRPSEFLLFDKRDLKGASKKDFQRRLDKGELELVEKRLTYRLYRSVEPPPAGD
jgi:uncharacterized membrane protein